jgi:hypothetical protein
MPTCLSVYAAAREIAAAVEGYTVVVTKSAVSVGTGDEVERIIREARPHAAASVVSNPEFLRGAAIRDFKHPDCIVVGAEDERAREIMAPAELSAGQAGRIDERSSQAARGRSSWLRDRSFLRRGGPAGPPGPGTGRATPQKKP